MASGDIVGLVLQSLPTEANRANPGIIQGATTTTGQGERWPTIDFDDSTDEYWDFLCFLHGYDGGGLTITIVTAATVTTNNAIYGIAIRAVPDDAEDMNTTDHTYSFNTVTVAAPSAVGEVSYDDITFTDGADMDSLADGEMFMLRFTRDADNASDTMTGDGKLLWPLLIIKET